MRAYIEKIDETTWAVYRPDGVWVARFQTLAEAAALANRLDDWAAAEAAKEREKDRVRREYAASRQSWQARLVDFFGFIFE